jgi:hypothetical protein
MSGMRVRLAPHIITAKRAKLLRQPTLLYHKQNGKIKELKFSGKDKTWLLSAYIDNKNKNNPLLSFIDDEQFNSGVGSHGLDKSNGHILSARGC